MSNNQLELGVYIVVSILFLVLVLNQPAKADTINTYCNTYGNVSTCDSYNNVGHTQRTDTTMNDGWNGTTGSTNQQSGYTQPMANETY